MRTSKDKTIGNIRAASRDFVCLRFNRWPQSYPAKSNRDNSSLFHSSASSRSGDSSVARQIQNSDGMREGKDLISS